MKKSLFLLLLVFTTAKAYPQSFVLPVPANWQVETMSFPIDFAPVIPFTGEEHLRFAPAWGDPKSEELWAYCFLWWIPADSRITPENLDKYMQAYYAGLVNRNIIKRKIDAALVVPTRASFKAVNTEKGDSKTYSGVVNMLDYMGLHPIALQIVVHVIPCIKEGKTGVFFEVSPQPRSHAVWQQFKMVREGFRCAE